ncbi:rhomboid-related protein 3 isoform X2 [Lepisosteus oculatus]|uniref:rhomboid-related protein 3 isoform X2 n=1 Tax=Lepisosteus oculatus TaxID=7918 RepID=UPI0037114067
MSGCPGRGGSSSPAVAANAEGDEIEVLESCDVLPTAPEEFDPENSGYISTERFRSLLAAHGSELDPHKLEVLLALADSNADGRVCYQDFVNLMSNKRSNSFRRAILQGSRQLQGRPLLEEPGLSASQRLVRHIAHETLPRELDRKWYYDNYTCCPPPWLILAITIAEVAVFVYYGVLLDRWVLQVSHPLFLKGALVYHPQLRAQAWRYLSYIFMHAGTPGSERDSAAAGGRPAGDGARGSEDRLCVPLWGPGRLPRGVGGGHDGAGGGVIRRGLRPGVCTSGQHRHELVGDEVPIQALSDRNGAGVDERGVRPGRVAALLPAGRPALPQPQLRGAPGRGGGGRDPGRGHAAELRAAAAGAVPLLDLRVRLRHLRALRHLLERLRLQPAGPQAPPPTVSREGWRLIFSPR